MRIIFIRKGEGVWRLRIKGDDPEAERIRGLLEGLTGSLEEIRREVKWAREYMSLAHWKEESEEEF